MSVSDLVFALTPGGTSLVFGDDGTPTEAHYSARLTASFQPLRAEIRLLPDRRAALAASFPSLTVTAGAQYASHAARPLVGSASASWQRGEETESGVVSAFAGTDSSPTGVESTWYPGAALGTVSVARFKSAQRSTRGQCNTCFTSASRLNDLRSSLWQDSRRDRRLGRRSGFSIATHLESRRCEMRHQDADRHSRARLNTGFEPSLPLHKVFGTDFGVAFGTDFRVSSLVQPAIRPPAGIWIRPIDPVPPGLAPSPHLLFYRSADGRAALLFGDASAPTDARIVVPIRRFYFVKNTQSLIRVEDGKEIVGTDLNLSIDVDSWVWGWSVSVPGHHLQDVLRVSAPVELEAKINGHAFRLAVENVSRDRRFASSRLSVSGRGRAAWLADPYAKVRAHTNTEAALAQQLMVGALTENGVPLGWSIDWQITDWLVPAGAWNLMGTPIDACLAIAEAAGAYIQAHPSEKVLRVLPRYPMAPWRWQELTPDIALPEDVCVTEGIEWVDKPNYNTVFVAGQQDGVLAHVTRAGTDGGMPAPMVTDPLITHADAGRQRGLSILADTGRQALISLSLPVLEETGIIMPGKIIRYSENGNTHLGLTRSVGVSSTFPKVRQTIQVETHV